MKYYKNVELAEKYHISEATVRKWVKATQDGKLPLELHREGGRLYVARTPGNMPVVEKLIQTNRKYRNSLTAKQVSPRPRFYELFTQGQIYDICRSLEMHHEIPRQYNYFDGGAEEWDRYINRVARGGVTHTVNRTIGLLADNQGYINRRLDKYKQVNVVDVGVGNALPARDFLQQLLDRGVLARYIALDISPEMLRIAENNIKDWFGGQVHFEGYELDITYERFSNLLAEDYLRQDATDVVNVVLFFGGTEGNLRVPDDAFKTIHDSMNPGDILIYTNKLISKKMRPEWFDTDAIPGQLALHPMHRLVFDLLNIDDSFYDVELGFDEQSGQHYERVR
ncbi:MAG TPA: L-histidine N(alpha)-methyltransferase, partial [Candidatus Saccharimonadales bacterium]|nr:L-histidine N(alpha)-methyltransferase [Candidatus Saccharimonadales bacterium]